MKSFTANDENDVPEHANKAALPYKALDGIRTGSATSWESMKAVIPASWKWVLPHVIRISEITLYNKYSGSTNVTKDVQVFADEDMTIPIGTQQTFDASAFSVLTVTPETPVVTDTIFIYCSSSYGAVGNNYVGLGEVVITAEYPAVIHTVTFLDWDGTLLNSQMVVDGESAVVPADPARDGFAFAGWDADFTEVAGDMTITATYEIDSEVFDYYEMLGSGHYPSAVHLMDNGFRIFYITDGGIVRGLECFPALGLYDDLVWTDRGRMSPDTTVSHMKLKKVNHHGAYGFWSAMGDHRFVMYMLSTDVSKYLTKGTGGFYTEFTVDSGDRKGRLTLSDYVSQIGRGGTSNCIIVEEPPEEEPPEEQEHTYTVSHTQ